MDTTMLLILLVSMMFFLLLIAIAIARAIRKKRMEYLREGLPKSRKKLKEDLESSISTGKTLLRILRERGVNVSRAESLMDQAEIAMSAGLYKRAEELLNEAKAEALKANKEHQEGTDILNAPPAPESEENPKEVFMRFPPYYLQAKFEMERAGDAIEKARDKGREIQDAVEILGIARMHFESENYEKAFSMAIKARKSAEGEVVEYIRMESTKIVENKEIMSESSETENLDMETDHISAGDLCPVCGARIMEGDRFCRKCGYEVLRCPRCGSFVFEDDVFCGKCGYKLVEEVFICPKCGTEISEDAEICPKCGARFE